MVGRALSFSDSGLRDWVWQRLSALVILGFTVVVVGYWWCHPGMTFAQWQALWHCTAVRVLAMLTLAAVCVHAWIGFWVVFTDYVRCHCLRLVLKSSVVLGLLAGLFWGLDLLFWLGR